MRKDVPVLGIVEEWERSERKFVRKSYCEVSFSREKRKGDTLAYVVVSPEDGEMEKIEVPLGISLAVLACASILGGAKRPVADIRESWTVKFEPGNPRVKLKCFPLGSDRYYSVVFRRETPYFFRFMGKLMNMAASLETWSVVLESNPPVTVTKVVRDMRPAVQVRTPSSAVHMIREEALAAVMWFQSLLTGGEKGTFYPDPEKKRRIYFGLQEENGEFVEGLRVFTSVYRDPDVLRLVCGLLMVGVHAV